MSDSTEKQFINIPVPAGTSTVFAQEFVNYKRTLTIGAKDEHDDTLLAIILDENSYIVEWVDSSTNVEAAVNFATDGMYLVFWDIPSVMGENGAAGQLIAAMLHERALYSDCFHWSEDVQENLPEAWVNGDNPKFTSQLVV